MVCDGSARAYGIVIAGRVAIVIVPLIIAVKKLIKSGTELKPNLA